MKKNKSLIKRFIPVFAIASTAILLASCPKVEKDPYEIGDQTGGELLELIHMNMLRDHTKYVTYSSYASYESSSNGKTPIDAYSASNKKIVDFYTGKQMNSYDSTMTREHVWACANSANLWTHNSSDGSHYVDGTGYKGGGSDLYHVRPEIREINTIRGNAKLYVFAADETPKYVLPGYSTPYKITTDKDDEFSNRFEPADQIKGDMARIIMYVYTHYTNIGDNSVVSDTVRSYLGSLDLKSIFFASYSLDKVHQLLVEWNELDPVDETEKLRNDTVEAIQGNRNPYVDHPEYIRKIWMPEDE